MKVSIEDVSSLKKRLVVSFPKEAVDTEVRREISNISKEAKVKGFRQGKAPLAIVEKIYMPEALKRYSERIIKETLQGIVTEKNLDIATRPVIEKEDFPEGGYEYHAIIEVHPKVELKTYKGMTFTKFKVNVSDDELNARIGEIRNSLITQEDRPEDAVSEAGDIVEFEVKRYFLDGKDMGISEKESIDLSRESIFPEIRSGLTGTRKGEVKEINFSYPEDIEDEKMRGKKVEFSVLVTGVKKKIMASDEELAKKQGFDDYQALVDKIKNEISAQKSKNENAKFKLDVFRKIAEENPFDVPEGMIEELAIKMVEDFARNMERAGVDLEKMQFDWKKAFEENRKQAEQVLKRHYIVKEVSSLESIKVTDDDLNGKIEDMTKDAKNNEKLLAYLQNPNVRKNLELELMEEKVFDIFLKNNTVVEE